jgi:hypothetical protein
MTGVLGTTVTMVHEAGRGPATTERHLSGGRNQLRINMIPHGPTHHLACIQIHKD